MNTVAKVYALNKLFANHDGKLLNYEQLSKYLFGQNDGVREELEELEGAVTSDQALDAYGDILTFADGLLFKAGIDLDTAVELERIFNNHGPHMLRPCVLSMLRECKTRDVFTLDVNLDPIYSWFDDYTPSKFLETAGVFTMRQIEFKGYDTDLEKCELLRIFTVVAWAYYRSMLSAAQDRTGFNIEAAYDRVHESNVSKLCWSQEERDASIASYCERHCISEDALMFDECESDDGRTYYVIRAARDVTFKTPDGDKFVPKGKFLKSINFVDPVFGCPPVWSQNFNRNFCVFSLRGSVAY